MVMNISKYFFSGFVLLIFTSVSILGQTITTTPQYPTANDEITLVFDATGTPLEDYNGQMYTHTGVGIEGVGNWQNVIGSWGNNSNQPELMSLGNNKWELLITPSLYEFYSVNPQLEVINLSFVFRSADANTQTADLFIPIFSNELMVIYFWGEGDANILEGSTYRVHAVSPLADSIFLFIDNELVYSTDQVEVFYETTVTGEYGYWNPVPVELMAVNATDTVIDSGTLTVFPEPMIEERPVGVTDGINYIDNNTVILSLYAPEKDYVFVIGDFNDWDMVEEHYMKKTPDGERYWIQIDDLVEGQEYIYQYLVDGYIHIGDPYAEKVSDPWNDHFIGEETYPGMLDYPEGQAEGIATVLQTAQPDYEWQITDFTPPAVTDLVIYELLIRDFTDLHTYNSLIDTLQYFKNLGINAIELMPVNEFEGNISWGYNPNYYFALDKYYGPKDTFKAFVDACHAEGIAVILDVVYNHSFGTSPYVLLYWNSSANTPSDDSPFYNVIPKHDFNVGFDMNHESDATKQYISRALKFWMEEYNIDGYRFDLSKGFTQTNTLGNTGQWGQYDQSRIDILSAYADTVRSVNEDAYIILEHFADNSEEKVLVNSHDMLIWGNMNYNYLEGAMGWTSNSNLSWGSYQSRDFNVPNLVTYMESHDEERMMYKNVTYGNSSNSNHNVKDTTIALKRVPLAAAFFFTIPGPKMIWQFGELGYDYSIDYNGRTGPKPIRWDYYDDYRRKLVFDLFASMIKLKTEYPTFRTTDYDLNVGGALKQISLNNSQMNATIVGNFSVSAEQMEVDFQHTGKWYDYFAGDSIDIASTTFTIDLGPGEFRIYTDQKLDRPEIGLGIQENTSSNVGFELIYPNPSAADFSLVFNVFEKSEVMMNIRSSNGSRIKTVLSEKMDAGEYLIKWNGTNDRGQKVAPGLYFVELISDGKREVRKISLF
jgi:1,4-alpha-glucan branching enzyme